MGLDGDRSIAKYPQRNKKMTLCRVISKLKYLSIISSTEAKI